MSFPPPRPPMMPPHGMPPMINQPPYSYSGMPMPPMPPMPPMGMMMNRPPPNFPMMNQTNKIPALNMNAPITKVFVGNISERAPDSMIRQMLQRCGSIINWKRVEGTNGKLQAFGFCEFAEPQYTLRCIRLLNGYEIAEKKLLVKVDQKTRELLGEYIKKNRPDKTKNARKAASLRNIRGTLIRSHEEGTEADEEDDPKTINLEAVDEDTLKEDRHTIGALELILKQYGKDLNPPEVPPVDAEKVPTNAPPPQDSTTPIVATDNAESSPEIDNATVNGIYMKPHLRLEEIKLDDDKKELMTSEISKFRETHKDEEIRIKQEEKDRLQRVQEKERIEKERIRASERRSDNNRRNRSNDRNDDSRVSSRSHRRSRSRSQHIERNGSPYRSSRRDQHRPSADVDIGSRSPERRSKNDSHNNKENNMTQEELEEERERKKLERKLREKELAYRARLKLWEEREEKKRRTYLVEKENELKKRKVMLKEARKLKQFMEDYDDEKDDSSCFKGSSLEKKLKFREKEIESDNRDRQREKEELEELKKRLVEKGFTDVDHEAKRIHEDENVRMKIKFEKIDQSSSSSDSESDIEVPSPVPPPPPPPQLTKRETPEPQNKMEEETVGIKEEINEKMNIDEPVAQGENQMSNAASLSEDSISSPFNQADLKLSKEEAKNDQYSSSPNNSNSPIFQGFNTGNNTPTTAPHVTIKAVKVAKSIQPINQAFADEDDEPNGPKRAKLISTSEQSTNSSGMNSEERKKAVKKLVESIPTDRDELFAYPVDWDQLDGGLMEKRIKPWINKKIIEYIGEEEATLHDFICSKIQQRCKPDKLLEEIKVILDDEAELFVKKMWRLIVYETESKRCGLSK